MEEAILEDKNCLIVTVIYPTAITTLQEVEAEVGAVVGAVDVV